MHTRNKIPNENRTPNHHINPIQLDTTAKAAQAKATQKPRDQTKKRQASELKLQGERGTFLDIIKIFQVNILLQVIKSTDSFHKFVCAKILVPKSQTSHKLQG